MPIAARTSLASADFRHRGSLFDSCCLRRAKRGVELSCWPVRTKASHFLVGDRSYEEVSRVNGRIDAGRRCRRMPVRQLVRPPCRRAGDATRHLRQPDATGGRLWWSGQNAANRSAFLVWPGLHFLRQHTADTIWRARLRSRTGNLKGRPCLADVTTRPARHGEGGPSVLSLFNGGRYPTALKSRSGNRLALQSRSTAQPGRKGCGIGSNAIHGGGQQPPECLISAARARSA
jgi:hypothetical protein